MRKLLLGKCGELALKGLNRRNFEDQLLKNIRRKFSDIKIQTVKSQQVILHGNPYLVSA